MNILLIGSGGREHAIALKLIESPRLTKLFALPGNPGIKKIADCLDIDSNDNEKILSFALENSIDLTIVGPEQPLVNGLVDLFETNGLKIFGPCKAAAQLEGSKTFAKRFMNDANIPTAFGESFTDFDLAMAYIIQQDIYPVVIKADGLAAGKGVVIAYSEEDARQALTDCFIDQKFASSGSRVLIEEFMEGEEASILAFTDGHTIIPMVSAQDHKAAYDGDAGPNTGGMGAYSPAPVVTPQVEQQVITDILQPAINEFKKRGILYKGVLYAGLMIKDNFAKVVEFNVRFGDPEAQAVLFRLETDLIDIIESVCDQRLHDTAIQWSVDHSICVVLAAEGYPADYQKGHEIKGSNLFNMSDAYWLIHAGTAIQKRKLVTNGGRVMGVVAKGFTLQDASKLVYQAIHWIEYSGKWYRSDIGAKAFSRSIEV